MEDLWIQVLVPPVIILIMASMGLELSVADFRRVIEIPKSILVGLTGQLVLLPLLGFAFATAMQLPPALALGVVIITACPGGAPSNVFTYLAGANIALSISLTAVSSLVTIVTIPLWVNLGLDTFMGEHSTLELPILQTFLQLVVVTILPVGLGMWIRSRWPDHVEDLRHPIKRLVLICMVVVAFILVRQQWGTIREQFAVAASSAIFLVLLAIAMALAFAKTMRLDRRDAFTISIEVGMQNGALATMIVVNLLGRNDLMIFPGAYAMLAFLPVALWTLSYRLMTARHEAISIESGS